MSASRETLIRARDRYASSPSHARWDEELEPGTYCVLSAFGSEPTWGFDEIELIRSVAGGGLLSLIAFNAAHTTEEVLDLFDRAIKEAA